MPGVSGRGGARAHRKIHLSPTHITCKTNIQIIIINTEIVSCPDHTSSSPCGAGAGKEKVWPGHETNAEMPSTYIYPRRKFEIIIIWPWILDMVLFTREL